MPIRSLRRNQAAALLPILILFLLACDATLSVGYPTPTILPPTVMPTVTPPSLKLRLTSLPYRENNLKPPSTITAQIPQLTGSDDPRVASFNEAVSEFLLAEIESFKIGLTSLPDIPQVALSTFDSQYTVIYQAGDLWSIRFDMNIYADGAAHPGDISRTFNYDFAHSQSLSLADLFLADSNYLKLLSQYCSDELATREIGFDTSTVGAEPIVENYRNWNITADGLLIIFDRGQVAAYAAPAQTITIPYSALEYSLNPHGPLAVFMR